MIGNTVIAWGTMESILIVDDSPTLVMMLKRRLNRIGYELFSAENGLEGVNKAMKIKPDLILMDMHMPVMDGYEATSSLRNRGYHGLICGLTASGKEEEIESLMEAGCDHIMAKPMEPDFEETIKAILLKEKK